MLFHRRVWRDLRHLEKKEETLSQDVNRQFVYGVEAGITWHNAWLCTETCDVLVPQASDNAVYGTQMGIELQLIKTEIETLHTYFWDIF